MHAGLFDFLVTPAPTGWKTSSRRSPVLWHRLADVVAPKLLTSPVSPRSWLQAAGPVYISGKPTQAKVVARILVSPRKKIQRGFFFRSFFSDKF